MTCVLVAAWPHSMRSRGQLDAGRLTPTVAYEDGVVTMYATPAAATHALLLVHNLGNVNSRSRNALESCCCLCLPTTDPLIPLPPPADMYEGTTAAPHPPLLLDTTLQTYILRKVDSGSRIQGDTSFGRGDCAPRQMGNRGNTWFATQSVWEWFEGQGEWGHGRGR